MPLHLETQVLGIPFVKSHTPLQRTEFTIMADDLPPTGGWSAHLAHENDDNSSPAMTPHPLQAWRHPSRSGRSLRDSQSSTSPSGQSAQTSTWSPSPTACDGINTPISGCHDEPQAGPSGSWYSYVPSPNEEEAVNYGSSSGWGPEFAGYTTGSQHAFNYRNTSLTFQASTRFPPEAPSAFRQDEISERPTHAQETDWDNHRMVSWSLSTSPHSPSNPLALSGGNWAAGISPTLSQASLDANPR